MKSTPPFPVSFRDRRSPRASRRRAFALVVVLIVISVLALVAVGYLASMGQERATANAFANKTRAEQSAQAGVDTAMGILRDYFKAFPDSATVWDTAQSQYSADPSQTNDHSHANEGTSLYFRAVSAVGNTDAPNPLPGTSTETGYGNANYVGGNNPSNGGTTGPDARSTFVLPLISGATVKPLANKANTVPALTAINSINLNSRRQINDTQGWIGTYPATGSLPKPINVPWVNILQQDNTATSPVIGRYAFWIEDESFRANISYAGAGASGNVRRDNSADYALDPTDGNLIGTLTAAGGSSDPATDAQNLLTVRGNYPGKIFPEFLAYGHTANFSVTTTSGLRYLTTSQSSALNLSRHGTQRLNLNAMVPQTTTTQSSASVVQKQFGKIVRAINFHAPNFGQRFYRPQWTSGTGSAPVPSNLNGLLVTGLNPTIYINKIAANILDYIDTDTLPTVIQPSANSDVIGVVRPYSKPTLSLNSNDTANPAWAFGKDNAPFLSECGSRYAGSTSTNSSGVTTYTVNVDYYIEVWNTTTRAVTGAELGPHAFIHIANPPKWMGDNKADPVNTRVSLQDGSGHTLSDTRDVAVPGRDSDIDISGVTFPPGAVTVITTDPNYSAILASVSDTSVTNQTEAALHFVVCSFISPGKRTYTGTIPTGCNEVRLRYDYSTSSDYDTEVIIGNDNGYIDSLRGGLPISGGVIAIPGTTSQPIYGGYLRGNLASGSASGGLQPSEPGDPRANNEQLTTIYHVPSSGSPVNSVDQTGYKVWDTTSSGYKIPPTLGLPNIYAIAPPKPGNPWPDYYWFPGNDNSHSVTPALSGSTSAAVMRAQNAPAIVFSKAMTSIGQLGDIYDPARLPPTSGGDINYSRGGGRTLRIGQHDDLYDGVINSASSTWASWRLADFLAINDSIEQPGLININGLARDNGAALKAAYQGFAFQPATANYYLADNVTVNPAYNSLIHGDSTLAGKRFDSKDSQNSIPVQNLITDIINNRLTNADPAKVTPFFERGELSETPILNPANSTGLVPDNGDMKSVMDRGREELMRRLLEMTTTRGNVFTVYAIGQAVNQMTTDGVTTTRVQATHQLRVTFKLVPKTIENKPFHPGTNDDGTAVDFDPTVADQYNARFAKPDHYDIQVLSVSSNNS